MPLTYLETIRAQDVDVPATKFNFFWFEFEHNTRLRDKSELHFK